jgi:cardiolipin synthase
MPGRSSAGSGPLATRRVPHNGRPRGRTRLALVAVVAILCLSAIFWAGDRYLRADESINNAPTSSSEEGVLGLIVEPEDGRRPVLAEIESARSTIDLMVYLLTDEPVIDALIDAEQRGVEVRVILDQFPYGGFGNPEEAATELRAAGAEVQWGPSRFTFSHVKTLIVDGSVALIMNLNLTRSAFESNREFAVASTHVDDVRTAQALFDADWSGLAEPDDDSLVVSPTNSRAVLLDLIDSAQVSLDIYAEVIRDQEVVDHLEAAAGRGVRVRVIVSPDADPVADRILTELMSRGIEVRLLPSLYVHAKATVVDSAHAFVGSQNFTATSLDENREVGIIVSDRVAVARLLATFEADFAASGEPDWTIDGA